MAVKNERDSKGMALAGRLVIGLFVLLLLWGGFALMTHKPTASNIETLDDPDATPSPTKTTSSGPVFVQTLKKAATPVLDYLPAGCIVGLHIPSGVNGTEAFERFHLFNLAQMTGSDDALRTLLSSLHGSIGMALYIGKDASFLLRAAIRCESREEADKQQKALAAIARDGKITIGFGFELYFERHENLFALSTDRAKNELITPKIDKPIRKLSMSYEIQSAVEIADSDALFFLNPALIGEYLDKKFPSAVAGELPIGQVIRALDLQAVNSAAIGLKVAGDGQECRLRMNGIRGEGLMGLISMYPSGFASSGILPESTVFFASQTLDISSLLQSMGGFLSLTNPSESAALPKDMESCLSEYSLAPATLVRAFTGESSLAFSLDNLLPDFWLSFQISEREVLDSLLAIAKAEGSLFEKEIGGVKTYGTKQPFINIPISAGFNFGIYPSMAVINNFFVIASSPAALQKSLAIAKGNAPSLASNEVFKGYWTKAANASSLVYARPAVILRTIRPWLAAMGMTISDDVKVSDYFYSYASRDYETLDIRSNSSVPLPFANYLLRPEWIPVGLSLAPLYDRVITMSLQAANWFMQRMYYYDYEHLDLELDLTGREIVCHADARVKSIVNNSTGFTFAFSPKYKIESIEIDGVAATWNTLGPFVMIRSKELIAKDKVCHVTIVARGYPEELMLLLPKGLTQQFRFNAHPIVTENLIHMTVTSMFYPSPPGLRNDLWTSKTTLKVKKGWSAICNGALLEQVDTEDASVWVYNDERPDMSLEVIAGPFKMNVVEREGFKVRAFFEDGAVKDVPGVSDYAADAYSFYAETFGGKFDPEPTLVFLKKRAGISHCLSYIVIYCGESTANVTAHELAHLWWGSMVKMNPLESEMWYEGLAEYSTMMYFRHKFGNESYLKYLEWAMAVWRSNDIPPVRYRDVRMWSRGRGTLGYYKGVAIMRGLETLLGREGFVKFLRELAKKSNEFQRLSDFWVLITSIEPNINWYIRGAFLGDGIFDLELRNLIKLDENSYEVEVRSSGINHWQSKVSLLIVLKSGAVQSAEVAFVKSNRTTVEIHTPEPIDKIYLDPTQAIPDINLANNVLVYTDTPEKKIEEEENGE